jgi:hypothetical protein
MIGTLGIISMIMGPVCYGLLIETSQSNQNTIWDNVSIQLTWNYENTPSTTLLTWSWQSWTKQKIPEWESKVWWTNNSKKAKSTTNQRIGEVSTGYSVDWVWFWVSNEIRDIQVKVWNEYWINPKYLTLVGMTENIYSPWKVWDNWCSYWIYQFNKCPWNRAEQVWFGKKFLDCAKDFECSTRMVAEKLRSAYKCEFNDGVVKDYACIYKHQWVSPSTRYKNLVDKNYALLFSSK